MKFFLWPILLCAALLTRISFAAPEIAISWPLTSGLRAGDLAPQFSLAGADGQNLDSHFDWGQKPTLLILDGAAPSLSIGAEIVEAANRAQTRGFKLIFVASNPQLGHNYRLPAPFATLRASDADLKALDLPTFVSIDRAGWLRQSEILPASDADPRSARLQELIESAIDPTPRLQVGQMAPDFSFRDASGNWRRVSALRGRKNLILTFFPKCFTGKCQTHLASLHDHRADFAQNDTEIWAVSVDPARGERGQIAFARALGLTFPLLPDEGRQISLLYGAASLPTDIAARQSVLIDKNGIVKWIDRNIFPATHGADLLARIRELNLNQQP